MRAAKIMFALFCFSPFYDQLDDSTTLIRDARCSQRLTVSQSFSRQECCNFGIKAALQHKELAS
jgi:hypothetical protein